MEHLRNQLVGADVLMGSFPPDFKEPEENAIEQANGYIVRLAERRQFPPHEEIRISATLACRDWGPRANSVLYGPGNCIFLALHWDRATTDNGSLRNCSEKSPDMGGGEVRPYGDCVGYLCRGSLPNVGIGDVEVGGGYLSNADGGDEGPHFLIICIDKNGGAAISAGSANFARDMQA